MQADLAHELCAERVASLRARYGHLRGAALLRPLIEREFPGQAALVSSFGAESAVLLHMTAAIDPVFPVLFIDTGKLFAETLAYRDRLIERLGLTNVTTLTPDRTELEKADGDGTLWARQPDLCCWLRKIEPLARALGPFRAWISGRKRYQSETRARLEKIEQDGPRIKINPLADFSVAEIEHYRMRHGLPAHPLVAQGFPSIGCAPCTSPVRPGESPRAGRWRGLAKTECGIHFSGGHLAPASPALTANSSD